VGLGFAIAGVVVVAVADGVAGDAAETDAVGAGVEDPTDPELLVRRTPPSAATTPTAITAPAISAHGGRLLDGCRAVLDKDALEA
jgi:hypothetical protein